MQVLLTNDDGIGATGLRVLYDALSAVADVTVVAPAADQSAVGRSRSDTVEVHDHELGYAVAGTPADCTIVGLCSLHPEADLVVAGCNQGANLSAYTLGRSGTVSAAVEATFFDVPAIATSLYIPTDRNFSATVERPEAYTHAAGATTYLVERPLDDGVFERADYLNVNAPIPDTGEGRMVVTHPSRVCVMDAVADDDRITIHDRIWAHMTEGNVPDPDGSDRRAVLDGNVSVSPLTAPHTTERHETLDALAAAYPPP